MEPIVARKMLSTLEPYHGWIYFAPEAPERYAALGVTDGRMGYFGSRSAPMGAVSAEMVIATFFNFNPKLVRESIPKVWTITTPEALIRARFEAADAMLRRVIGDDVTSEEMNEAAKLARVAAEACTPQGRPLFAGHATLAWPVEPHLVLWHALTLIREFRGDGHIAALVAAGLGPVEALVTHGAMGPVTPAALQSSRAWPDADWQAAVDRLRSRGWLDADGAFTEKGTAARDEIERITDELALPAWEAIGEDPCRRLRELVRPWSRAIVASGGSLPTR